MNFPTSSRRASRADFEFTWFGVPSDAYLMARRSTLRPRFQAFARTLIFYMGKRMGIYAAAL